MVPENLRYTKDHEWIRVDGETGVIGITDHAQEELGDIVYVELPKTGVKLDKSASFGSVESVKAVSDIYCPVAGEVLEINPALAEAPEKVNDDPYGEGWLIKLKLSDTKQTEELMSPAQYEEYIGAES
jgi:glycine cleavage system H protein